MRRILDGDAYIQDDSDTDSMGNGEDRPEAVNEPEAPISGMFNTYSGDKSS